MLAGGLVVPIGINSPFMQCAIEMGPDHFVLTIDRLSRNLTPALIRPIANTATTSGDVIKGAVGKLDPTHARGVFLEFNRAL